MNTKTFRARIQFKADGSPGEFSAGFATLNVIDLDGDVTLPGAFREQRVIIEPWNHQWGALPVGKGAIREESKQAIVGGMFFLDTLTGMEHYKTVKNLGDQQEWSYSFDIEESEMGKFEGKPVRFLKKLNVIGVGPVTRGAGIDTATLDIKGAGTVVPADGLKPYPHEHACRLREPGDFQADSFRRTQREHEGKKFSVILGRLKDEETMTEQAYRYADEVWTAAEARSHCKAHEGRFEAATGKAGSEEEHGQEHGDEALSTTSIAGATPRSPTPDIIRTRIEIELLEE